jgi:hypothetical protein
VPTVHKSRRNLTVIWEMPTALLTAGRRASRDEHRSNRPADRGVLLCRGCLIGLASPEGPRVVRRGTDGATGGARGGLAPTHADLIENDVGGGFGARGSPIQRTS